MSEAAVTEPFTIGEMVSKVGGDYRFDGRVVSRFYKISGALRYVVEDDRGVLHVYSHKNLRKSERNDGVAQRIEHGDSTSGVAGSNPAAVTTAPAPAVCEWVEQTHPRTGNWLKGCDGELRWIDKQVERKCHVCGKPIKWTWLGGDAS